MSAYRLEPLRYRSGYRVWINDENAGEIAKIEDLVYFLNDYEARRAIAEEQATHEKVYVGYSEVIYRQPILVYARSEDEAKAKILAGEGQQPYAPRPHKPWQEQDISVEEWTYHHQQFWND
jgi:hypothetical protein